MKYSPDAAAPALSMQRLHGLVLAAILAVATFVRFGSIGDALWLDEAYSVWFASQPLGYLWTEVPKFEPHPPFYYSFLKIVLWFGDGEFALRLPSILCSLATLPVLHRIVLRLGLGPSPMTQAAALLATALCALSAVHVSYAQEARTYAALALCVAVMMWAAVELLHRWQALGPGQWMPLRSPWPATLVIAAILTCWLHNLGALYVAAIMAVLGLRCLVGFRQWRRLAEFVGMNLLILIGIFYNVQHFIISVRGWTVSTWMSPLNPYRIRVILQEMFALGAVFENDRAATAVLLALLAAMACGLWVVLRRNPWNGLLLGAVGGLPPVMAIGASLLLSPIFSVRMMLPATLPLFILLALACTLALPRRLAPLAALPVAGVFLAGTLAGYAGRPNEPWNRAAETLLREGTPQEIVLTVPNDVEIPVLRYLGDARGRFTILPLPAPYPALNLPNRYISGSPAVPELSEQDIAAILVRTAQEPTLWFVSRYNVGGDLQRALAERRPILATHRFGPAITLWRFGAAAPLR